MATRKKYSENKKSFENENRNEKIEGLEDEVEEIAHRNSTKKKS